MVNEDGIFHLESKAAERVAANGQAWDRTAKIVYLRRLFEGLAMFVEETSQFFDCELEGGGQDLSLPLVWVAHKKASPEERAIYRILTLRVDSASDAPEDLVCYVGRHKSDATPTVELFRIKADAQRLSRDQLIKLDEQIRIMFGTYFELGAVAPQAQTKAEATVKVEPNANVEAKANAEAKANGKTEAQGQVLA